MFRGREITHPEIGRGLLLRVQENLRDIAVVERQPIMEGRFMNMYLAPVPQKSAPKPKAPRPARPAANDAAPPGDTAMAAALKAAGVDAQPAPAEA
jgi:translation initiation factor IF-3